MRNKILATLILFTCICPVHGNCETTHNESNPNQTASTPQPIVVNVISPKRTDQEAADQKAKDDYDSSIKTRELWLTLVIAVAAIVQAGVSIFQWRVYRLQTRAMFSTLRHSAKSATAAIRSVNALEKLERPFLMVELRGADFKDQVWIVNKGKVPAQIRWYNPDGKFLLKTHEEIDNLPTDFDYGFLHDSEGAQILNVPWIAPEGEMYLCRFNWIALSEELTHAYQTGQKYALLVGLIRYKGMVTDKIYESRWCVRWLGNKFGLKLDGPFGYNDYT